MSSSKDSMFIKFFAEIGGHFIFFKETLKWTFRPPFDGKNFIIQLAEIGYKSLPVTSITTFFTGMVMALQMGKAMDSIMSGSSIFIGSAVAIALFRELCPVLTALLLAGRVGSSIAAEIGTMKVTEQTDALRTLAADPVHYLSVPRFLACFIMTPLLTVVSDVVGILGGALVSVISLDISVDIYFKNILQYLSVGDFLSGLVKSFFFGIEIAVIACYQGFSTSGGAEGVGRSTIQAVVKASMAVLVSDYFLTYLIKFFE